MTLRDRPSRAARPPTCARVGDRPAHAAPARRALGARHRDRHRIAWSPSSASPSPARPTCSRELDRLGTNLLQVRPGSRSSATTSRCPTRRRRWCAAIGPVERVGGDGHRPGATVWRTDRIDGRRPAASPSSPPTSTLLDAVAGNLDQGAGWTRRPPGARRSSSGASRRAPRDRLARRLAYGVDRRPLVHRDRHPRRRCRCAQLDRTALIGFPAAERWFGDEGTVSTIYVRAPRGPRRRRCASCWPRPRTQRRRARSRCRAIRRARGRRPPRHPRSHELFLGARRGGAAGRRHRHRERDGDLGARAAVGDRRAPGARRDAPARAAGSSCRVAAAAPAWAASPGTRSARW